MARLIDRFGRTIDYLRVSVVDRCNLRCVYCLPEAYKNFTPGPETLSDDEFLRVIGTMASMGTRRLRLTGGEPLLRPGLEGLIARLKALAGIEEISLSTNGMLLADRARALKKAGLDRVNVSLDTLDPARFREVARFGDLETVLRGIDAALEAGLAPVKLNTVVARGLNEGEIASFARLTVERPVHARFIELMPMGETGYFSDEKRVPLDEMLRAAAPLEPLERGAWPAGAGPARYFRRPGALGTIGFIAAMSCGFCDGCNRMRLSCTGRLIPCLDGEEGVDLRRALRAGAGPEEIERLVRAALAAKPEAHRFAARAAASAANPRFMCQIGG